jgi:hypothetical protein
MKTVNIAVKILVIDAILVLKKNMIIVFLVFPIVDIAQILVVIGV